MMDQNQLPVIEDILPHRGNMLFINRLIDFTSESTVAVYAPESKAWYANHEGNMPAWIGIELMAQTVAAHVGIHKRREGLPQKNGVLVGTRSYQAMTPHFVAGKSLKIQVTVIYQDISGLGAYDCTIADDNLILATATLKVFEPDDFQTFLEGSIS